AYAGAGGTRLRIRVWQDGSVEPASYNIDIVDSASGRLSVGRLGFWASRKGIKALDDVAASGTAVIGLPTPTTTPTPGGPSPTQTPTPGGPTPIRTPTPTPGPGAGVVVHLTESIGPLLYGSLFTPHLHTSRTI